MPLDPEILARIEAARLVQVTDEQRDKLIARFKDSLSHMGEPGCVVDEDDAVLYFGDIMISNGLDQQLQLVDLIGDFFVYAQGFGKERLAYFLEQGDARIRLSPAAFDAFRKHVVEETMYRLARRREERDGSNS